MAQESDSARFHEQDRELARRTAAQLAGESTSVIHFAARKVVYDVPGRRRNGTQQSTGATRVLQMIVMAPLAILYIPVMLFLSLLAEAGIQLHSRRARQVSVHGDRACTTPSFADAVRASEGSLWLAWSKSQVTLMTTSDHGPQVVWRSSRQDRPELKIAKTTVRWADGSRVEFDLSPEERQRVTERNGTP
ncbi:hypothetical protein QFW96_02220 [Saccharopolyspora sp. TS4A08]|uniref:Uncharacterized protein n=1 Tax=Saccharopolyspora ipomoeae TaxID=3042027 RepID=A0ABT6PHC5_9PSEU|nr:hypothetical protein [Saccharopolyspora sp. TS4A08]MDI2027403.1 hypothetical protein [Saccharopolyspora sp. TS4A08]